MSNIEILMWCLDYALDRFAVYGISSFVITPSQHFFQPVNVPSDGQVVGRYRP